MVSNNYFKTKLSLLDFIRIPEVKKIKLSIEEIEKSKRKDFIVNNNLAEKLKEIYWIRMYGSKEEFLLAEQILEKTLFSGNLSNKEKLIQEIDELTIDKPDLKNKILNICPNGDSIVSNLIKELIF